MFIIAVLNGDSRWNPSGAFPDQRVGMIHLSRLVRQEVRTSHADPQFSSPLIHAAEIGLIFARKPFSGHEVGVLHGYRFRKRALQSRHVREDGIAIDRWSEVSWKQLPALSKRYGCLRKIDSLGLAIEFLAEREQEFVKPLLNCRVPSSPYPALWQRARFVIVFDAVLLLGSAIVPSVVKQILRHVDYCWIKRDILKLDEQLLPF